MKAKYFHPAIAIALLLVSSAALAQDEQLNWNSLTDEQRQVLSSLEESWDTLSLERRERLAEGAVRWTEMGTEDRAAARQRFQTWRSLSEDQRARIRERYQQFQRLTPTEKARIRNNFERFRDLHSFTHRFCREDPRRKNIDVNSAVVMLGLLFKPTWPAHASSLCEYFSGHKQLVGRRASPLPPPPEPESASRCVRPQAQRGVSHDEWMMALQFCREILPDCSNFQAH